MSSGDKWTIEELATRYNLHPELRDIYVEGHVDVETIEWFLHKAKNDNGVLYEIGTVEIPAELVRHYNLCDNNRSRAIVFAIELQSRLGQNAKQITCIIDADFDIVLGRQYSCNYILITDYANLEMYLFNESCLNKYLKMCIRGFKISAVEVLKQLSIVLQELFLIRLANELLGLGLEEISFTRCCKIGRKREIIFNVSTFIDRYLSKKQATSKKDEFIKTIESRRPKLTKEPRNQMHGHDFICLLSWYLHRNGVVVNLANQDVLEGSLFGCVEYRDLVQEPLFSNLLNRVS